MEREICIPYNIKLLTRFLTPFEMTLYPILQVSKEILGKEAAIKNFKFVKITSLILMLFVIPDLHAQRNIDLGQA